MTLAAAAFALGAAWLQQQAELPAAAWAWTLVPLALAALWKRELLFLLTFAFGFFWADLLAAGRMDDWLSPALEGRDLRVAGVISGLPARGEQGERFELEVESAAEKLPRRIVLSRFATPDEHGRPPRAVHPGERWAFTVRLRRPHGNVNPQGFDYEAWLLERGLGATGYVRPGGEQRLLGSRNSFLDWMERAREAVRDRFLETLGPTPAAGILAALAVGDQRAISSEEWTLFNRTGVTHLMSISGLHVTLVSGLFAWLVSAVWRRIPPLCLRLPARKAAAAAAIAGALGYTLLAGFGVPAQRTFYMVSVAALALWSGRVASPMRVLALALAAVVLADPWAPLSPGFWLSFGAVFLIFYVASGWSGREHWAAQWGRVQWAITIGLAPAALLLFGQISFAGPLANAAAIPVVSAVVTPLALAAAVLPFEPLLAVAAWLVQGLLQFLEWCAALPGALWQQHIPPWWAVGLALLGAAWMLSPRGVPWRPAGLALALPAFAWLPAAPSVGGAWISTLDVGEGLAVIVRTANRVLVYDAGPTYGPEADGGGRVVLPALRSNGLGRLDALVLTHEDTDHIGGAVSLLDSLEVGTLWTPFPPGHPLHALATRASACLSGRSWSWDGVRFEFLSPAAEPQSGKRNDSSCVLRIEAGGRSMLLTADLEKSGELSLLERKALPRSDVLLVPHHGSRSSSSALFVASVAPRWAVISSGYRNRFGHPSAEVLERYGGAGAAIVRTDLEGAVHVELASGEVRVATERRLRPRYWRRMRLG